MALGGIMATQRIENFSWSENRNIGHLINLFGQAIAEGASITNPVNSTWTFTHEKV